MRCSFRQQPITAGLPTGSAAVQTSRSSGPVSLTEERTVEGTVLYTIFLLDILGLQTKASCPKVCK